MENIAEILEGVKTMGMGGHIRPDVTALVPVWRYIYM